MRKEMEKIMNKKEMRTHLRIAQEALMVAFLQITAYNELVEKMTGHEQRTKEISYINVSVFDDIDDDIENRLNQIEEKI